MVHILFLKELLDGIIPWDVASGCIWNSNIIKNTELIYQKKKDKYVKI